MKTILITLALSFTAAIMTAQTETTTVTADQTEVVTDGTTITITVPVRTAEGSVLFTLHSEETFMREGLADLEAEIVDGKAIVTFENIPAGSYGVLLFHDANGNKKMDFEPNGMPKEMYGVSNNAMSFGPPMWSNAKFEVAAEPITLEIRM